MPTRGRADPFCGSLPLCGLTPFRPLGRRSGPSKLITPHPAQFSDLKWACQQNPPFAADDVDDYRIERRLAGRVIETGHKPCPVWGESHG